MELNRLFYDFLINLKFPEFYAELLNLLVLSIIVFLVLILLKFFIKESYF